MKFVFFFFCSRCFEIRCKITNSSVGAVKKRNTHSLLFHNGFNVAHVSTRGFSHLALLFFDPERTSVGRALSYFSSIDYFFWYEIMETFLSRVCFKHMTFLRLNLHKNVCLCEGNKQFR